MEREISSISTTSTITRRVRNRPTSNTFEYISPEAIKIYSCEEPITDDESTDCSSYSEDEFEKYESDEDEDGQTIEIAVDVDLGCGVIIQTYESLQEFFKCYKADIWTPEEKNRSLHIPKKGQSQKTLQFVTELFKISKISSPDNDHASFDVYNEAEKERPVKHQCEFSVREKYANQFWFKVPYAGKSLELTYSVWTYCKNNWEFVEATYDGKFIQFKVCRLDSFVVLTTPKLRNGIVHPSGTTLQLDNNNGFKLVFDNQCVETEQQFSFKVQPKYSCNTQNSLVKGCSEKICLQYQKDSFKPFSMICRVENENGSDFEGEIRLVSFSDNRATVVDRNPDHLGNNIYRGQIDGYNRIALVSLSSSNVNDSDFIDTLTKELEVVYKEKYICRIMLFYRKKIGNILHFVAECCLAKDCGTVKRKHREVNNKKVFESVDLYLPPQQRIRIHPSGSIANKPVRPGKQVHNFLFFMYVSKDNTCTFSVQLNISMGGSPDAMIEFSADNKGRGVITKAEFAVDQLYTRSPISRPLSRGYTFFGGRAQPGRLFQRSNTTYY